MKKTIKTKDVLAAYRLLGTAKYTQLDNADKIRVWKIASQMKPLAEKYDELRGDAAMKFKPETEGFDKMLEKAQKFERIVRLPNVKREDLPMGAAEYDRFIVDVMTPYDRLVDKALQPFVDKEVKLDIDELSEEAFGALIGSNDWIMDQIIDLGNLIMNRKKQ